MNSVWLVLFSEETHAKDFNYTFSFSSEKKAIDWANKIIQTEESIVEKNLKFEKNMSWLEVRYDDGGNYMIRIENLDVL